MKTYDIGFPLEEKYLDNFTQGFGKEKTAPSVMHFYKELGLIGHNGIDWRCPVGTPVYASHDGVAEVYTSSDGNNMVMIWDREELKIRTFYCHLSEFKCKNGDTVKRGQIIALSGNTGKYTTGPHLHFGLYELTRSGNDIANRDNGYNGAIDPEPHLARKFPQGTFIKHPMDARVYEIWNQKKWWIMNEDTFKDRYDIPVGKAKIEIVDNITLNYYKYAGAIGKSSEIDKK